METRINNTGYKVFIFSDRRRKPILQHLLLAEYMFGGSLPTGYIVHHIDGDKLNNNINNLMLCTHIKYHKILHRRLSAQAATGYTWYRKCNLCKKYDHPDNLRIHPHRRNVHHADCIKKFERNRYYVKERYIKKGPKGSNASPTHKGVLMK